MELIKVKNVKVWDSKGIYDYRNKEKRFIVSMT